MSSIELSLIGVGPARAGMIRDNLIYHYRNSGWPRTSGDDPYCMDEYGCSVQLAPHERG